LAFLGRNYDDELRQFYTEISTKDVLVANPLGGIFGGSALASNRPLAKLIAKIVDRDLLQKIAAQHKRGRRIYIVTTNLEAQRPVVWNMGLIARIDTPEALELFRALLLASSVIPGAFPPVTLEIDVDGQTYTELHVDGGTTANSFVAPLNAKIPPDPIKRDKVIHVIQDGKLSPEPKKIKPRTMALAGRAIDTLLQYKNYADIRRLYLLAQKHDAGFRLIAIPDTFKNVSKEAFDKEYMTELYKLGFSMGQSETGWVAEPDVF
jgi:predicted acylesterase/phospholipase RssA